MKKQASSSLHLAHSRDAFSRLIFESEHSMGGGDNGRSVLFRLFQLLVVVLRLVTPACYLFLLCVWFFHINAANFLFGPTLYFVLLTWSIAEALFLPYYYLLFLNFSVRNKKLDHVAADTNERFLLAKRCFTAMAVAADVAKFGSTDAYIRKVLEGWFIDTPIEKIHRENMASWCSWAFFDSDLTDLTAAERAENEQILSYIEHGAKWKFPPGYAPGVLPARLTLDPVFATQRPLYFYVAIGALNWATHLFMYYALGFSRLRQYDSPSQYVYYRAAKTAKTTNTTNTKTASSTTAHHSAQHTDNSNKQPIVFVHGIGIGFTHYLGMIMSFPTDTDVFLIEWPHVAMQMAMSGPTPDATVRTVCTVLDEYHHRQACFVAHSLGTALVSWMLHDVHGCHRVHSTVLIDPVTFLLCEPTVATSFVYKNPTTELEFMMHFFVSRELFIANGLSRHFSWSHNILFVEDLLNPNACCREAAHTSPHSCSDLTLLTATADAGAGGAGTVGHHHCRHVHIDHTIILSSKDAIVPTSAVLRYLQAKVAEGFSSFEVILFDGSHGEIMLLPAWLHQISLKIEQHIGYSEQL